MRGVLLHARCRAIPATLLGLLLLGLLARAVYGSDTPKISDGLGRAAVLLGAAATAHTFAGPDAELERAAAVPWWLVRAGQLLLLAAVLYGVVAAARQLGEPAGAVPHALLVRQAVGFVSLVALGAAAFGARAAWILAAGWGLLAMSGGPWSSVPGEVVNWMYQDPATTASTATFTALTAAGAGAYLRWGSRPSTG